MLIKSSTPLKEAVCVLVLPVMATDVELISQQGTVDYKTDKKVRNVRHSYFLSFVERFQILPS